MLQCTPSSAQHPWQPGSPTPSKAAPTGTDTAAHTGPPLVSINAALNHTQLPSPNASTRAHPCKHGVLTCESNRPTAQYTVYTPPRPLPTTQLCSPLYLALTPTPT